MPKNPDQKHVYRAVSYPDPVHELINIVLARTGDDGVHAFADNFSCADRRVEYGEVWTDEMEGDEYATPHATPLSFSLTRGEAQAIYHALHEHYHGERP